MNDLDVGTCMQLALNTLHIWHADLRVPPHELAAFAGLLDSHEKARAERFHFPLHRARFIAAHGLLRKLIENYTGVAAQAVTFTFNTHQKPALAMAPDLQFNLSHSDDQALFAFRRGAAVGVDIEKIETGINLDIAKRFFSEVEYSALMALPEDARAVRFYKLWAYKEALIKGVGKGLALPLSSFSVDGEKRCKLCGLNLKLGWCRS